MAHKEFDLLIDITNKLYHPDIDIFIHIDIKAKVDIPDLLFRLNEEKVTILSDRLDVVWGGYSILKTQLLLLSMASEKNNYDYYCCISGQDFPLITPTDFLDFFIRNRGKEFLEYFALPSPQHWGGNGGLHRFQYFWPVDEMGFHQSVKFYEKQLRESLKRTMPEELTPYGGSNWISITGSCVRYIFDKLMLNPSLLLFFSMVAHPEEIFFQTLILNSHFKDNVINDNKRYIDWSGTPSPRILNTQSDIDNIETSNAHFARKFERDSCETVLDYLNKKLLPF
ncbi:hypothetical protein N824_15035 [Pedobacter sp. V48]|nr:hypothetical protein N824_15035 [Pedobacter sp. V48]